MKEMPDNSVDSIVTDPPYELGFMGKSWDASGIAFNIEVWQEALRVLKPGGHLLAFSGSRTYHRMAVAIEDAGFQIRDQIMWVYGSGFPKSHNIEKAINKVDGVTTQWQGWGTALKPAHEPIVVARKPLEGTVAANVLTYGTGGLNIDGTRVGTEGGTTGSGYVPNDTPIYGKGLGNTGEVIDLDKGRFPAKVIHDGSDEVVALFPDTKSGKLNKANITAQNAIYGNRPKEMTGIFDYADSGSAARFFYCAKASKRDRNEGLEGFEGKKIGAKGNGLARKCATCSASVIDGCACPDRTFINPTRANHHPTVKPTALMQYLVRLVTPPNGTVLDPFMGSGSTGKAAMLEGFDFIGIEQELDYLKIAQARIEQAVVAQMAGAEE